MRFSTSLLSALSPISSSFSPLTSPPPVFPLLVSARVSALVLPDTHVIIIHVIIIHVFVHRSLSLT